MKNSLKLGVATGLTAIVLACGACTTTQRGIGAGTILGGATGAVIGHQSGKVGKGALIGAGVGAIFGGLIGSNVEKSEAIKYCPICGEHYQETVQYCTRDGTQLLYRK